MKIPSVGPNEIPPRRAGESVGAPVVRGEEISAKQNASLASHTSARTFTEALVIAHTAKSIVNRAIEIAFQLQGLATRTLASGSADQAEIARVVSAANAVMSESEHGSASAVIVPQINGVPRENRTIEYTPVRESLQSLRAQAEVMQSGGRPDVAKINSAISSLEGVRESIESSLNELNAVRHLKNIERSEEARGDIAHTASAMFANPMQALAVQGNIHPERARDLLG